MNQEGKLLSAEKAYASAEGKDANKDNELDQKRHDRSYNPVDGLPKRNVSEALNGDAGKYRKGPGPF